MEETFGTPISVYTRKQAIDDGVLFDVTKTAKEIGFKLHTVIATGLMGEIERESKRAEKDLDLIVYFLLKESFFVIRNSSNAKKDSIIQIPLPWTPHKKFWSHIGPGDDGEPVLTFMMPEDY